MVSRWVPRSAVDRLPRFSMPSGLAQVCVQLELVALQNVEPMVGQLWDISQRGGCIVLPGLCRIAVPAESRLKLRDPMGHGLHELEADLRWCTPLSHSTFVGLQFTGGPAPSDTFLATYMQMSWTDAVPVSRLIWPGT